MIRSRIILFFIIALVTTVCANPFSTYKEYLGLSDAKLDSFYVVDPVISKSMFINDTLDVYVENRFNLFLPAYEPDSVSIVDDSLITAKQILIDGELYVRVISNDKIGRTDVTYTVFADTLFENQTSDTFTLTVDDPAFDWIEFGSAYSFQQEYCIGIADTIWKAATHFSLGTDSIHLKQIEFGFAMEEMVDWKLVWFDEEPTDSLLGDMADSVLCSAVGPTYIEGSYIDSNFTDTYLTGEIALVFSSEGNFMSLDPSGESSNTWIWDETNGWALANSYTSAYDGAWYMRLQVYNVTTTGINETYYSGTISNFELQQNYPNPFNPTTEINFTLNHNSLAKLTVFNSSGEVVKALNNSKLAKGRHSFSFDGQDLNSGLYFYQLEVDGVRSTKKMILMK